jgi:hypothetical protein
MSWDQSLFTTIQSMDPGLTVTIADSSAISVQGISNVVLKIRGTGSRTRSIMIQRVYFMPDLNINLLSVSALESCQVLIASRIGGMDLTCQGKKIATATRTGRSYSLDLAQDRQSVYTFTGDKIIQDRDNWSIWHR